jgi:superfamily I DNA/RNA helicase
MADSLILNNHIGVQGPKLHPRPENPHGIVRIVQWPTIEEEIAGLTSYIQHLVQDLQIPPRDILVLSSRKLLGYGLRDLLREAQIPTHSFYHEESLEPDEAQDRFALLTLLARPNDRVAQRFLLGYGSGTWHAGEYRRLRTYCEQAGLSPWDALQSFEDGVPAPAGLGSLRERFAHVRQALATYQGLQGSALATALFPENEEWANSMNEAASTLVADDDQVEQVYEKLLVGVTQPELPESGDYVRVMSLHKSKGLTSRVVIVAGCVLGLIPSVNRRLSDNEQEALEREQRRLFYVAITRPTERLVISSFLRTDPAIGHSTGAVIRRDGRTIASPFMAELGPHAPQPIRGDVWRQNVFA